MCPKVVRTYGRKFCWRIFKNANGNLAKMNEEIQYFYWCWFSIFIDELKYCKWKTSKINE